MILNFLACLYFFQKHLAILFNNVLERKLGFLDYKFSFSKSRKICIFANGLTHDFGQKFEVSCMSVFLQKTAGSTF